MYGHIRARHGGSAGGRRNGWGGAILQQVDAVVSKSIFEPDLDALRNALQGGGADAALSSGRGRDGQ